MPTYTTRGAASRTVLSPNNNFAGSFPAASSHGSWDAADWRSKFLDAERRLEKQVSVHFDTENSVLTRCLPKVAESSMLRERLQDTERKLYHCELDAKLSQDTAKVCHNFLSLCCLCLSSFPLVFVL
jgi:hypothetical protein